jgi:xanthine/uracil/vitamin C permease (AzgA family)
VGLVQTSSREGGTMQLGDIWTPQACITLCCYLITGTLLHKKFKAAIMLGLLLGSVMFWGYMGTWPKSIFSSLSLAFDYDFSKAVAILPSAANNFIGVEASYWPVLMLTIDLFFIVIVLFSGLTAGMSHCAGLTRDDGSTPRSRWLYFACGVGTMLGAFCGSGPILLSGESIVGETNCNEV